MSLPRAFIVAAALCCMLASTISASAAPGGSSGSTRSGTSGSSFGSFSGSRSSSPAPAYRAPPPVATPAYRPPASPPAPSPTYKAPAPPIAAAAKPVPETPSAARSADQPRSSFGAFGSSRTNTAAAAVGMLGAAAVAATEVKPLPSNTSALNRSLEMQNAQSNARKAMDERSTAKAAHPESQSRSDANAALRPVQSAVTTSQSTMPRGNQVQDTLGARRESEGISPLTAGVLGYAFGRSGSESEHSHSERPAPAGVSPQGADVEPEYALSTQTNIPNLVAGAAAVRSPLEAIDTVVGSAIVSLLICVAVLMCFAGLIYLIMSQRGKGATSAASSTAKRYSLGGR